MRQYDPNLLGYTKNVPAEFPEGFPENISISYNITDNNGLISQKTQNDIGQGSTLFTYTALYKDKTGIYINLPIIRPQIRTKLYFRKDLSDLTDYVESFNTPVGKITKFGSEEQIYLDNEGFHTKKDVSEIKTIKIYYGKTLIELAKNMTLHAIRKQIKSYVIFKTIEEIRTKLLNSLSSSGGRSSRRRRRRSSRRRRTRHR